MNVTLYAICRNEEKNIQNFLKNCKHFSEVVVVDTGSTDDSVKLLRKNGITVYEHPQEREDFDFSLARNTALSYVDTEWAFSIDFNETIENFSEDIDQILDSCTEIRHRRFDDINGKISESKEILPRFHRKENYKWENRVHEVLSFIPSEKFTVSNVEGFDIKITKHFSNSVDKDLFYLSLCEQEYEKDPNNPHYIWFIVNHYYNVKNYEKTVFYGERFIGLTKPYENSFRPKVFIYCSIALMHLEKEDISLILAMSAFSESQYFDLDDIVFVRNKLLKLSFKIGFGEMALFFTSILPDENTVDLKKQLIQELYENIN